MRLGTVTSAPAVRGTSYVGATTSVTPVKRITGDWVEEDPLDELTQSDRALLSHLYGKDTSESTADSSATSNSGSDADSATDSTSVVHGAAQVSALAAEINRERKLGMVSDERDLTAEDLRRMLGRMTVTSREPVPVQVQLQLMSMLKGSNGRLDVVL